MLQQQPAAGRQVRGRLRHDAADVVQPIGAADQGLARLVRQRGQVRVGVGNVGRVADDQVKAFARHWRQPVAQAHVDAQAQPLGIGARHGERVGAGVHRHHLRQRPLLRDGQRDGAAARAQVEHAARGIGRQQRQRPVDQRLGVVARVEHAGIDAQRQAVECLLAGQISHRLARQPARGQRLQAVGRGFRQRIGVVRQQPGAGVRGLLQHVQQQHLRLQPGQAAGLPVAQGIRQGGHWLLLKRKLLAL